MKNDQFANIAAGGVLTAGKGLEAPTPEQLDKKTWAVNQGGEDYGFPPKMNTKEELYEELERWKEAYRPYMKKLAPKQEKLEKVQELKTFLWREETREDQNDFRNVLEGAGSWETVEVPHYGGPLGMAVTYYRTNFQVNWEANEAVFLYFKGVDYIAKVYVNGSYAGSHEGFFAPFRIDISKYARQGENTLVVQVENDFIHKRNEKELHGTMYGGDKIYAATGPGFDDPQMGWHHCPPGMGIWQQVYVEVKSRCFIQDVYVRPLPEEGRAEAWLDIYKCDPGFQEVKVNLSLYGRNFEETIFENMEYIPETECTIGLGDSFTEANLTASGAIERPVPLLMEKGENELKIPWPMDAFRHWTPDTPYLYELQVELIDGDGQVIHRKSQSFGMRSFTMDTKEAPKGNFYLNGEVLRLRGANTMGHEQQCVIKGDMEQLIEDILLARICHMNFLRLTQRPVQEEIYEYCDMLGMLTQTDLPLFGVLRIPQFTEALRQTGEMEKLIRKHPCNIMVSYINEPFPNANNQPHRHLSRANLQHFFECADAVVKMNNPERVTKHVDGDYDPPSNTLPDNHCYTLWYNGHGVDAGALDKGYWFPVKPDWNYGCGEFGAEGLDPIETMRKYYPLEWLPKDETEEKNWSPARIIASQTGNFHYFFYDTPDSLQGWIESSQIHQAWAAKWMTESFRRNKRMVTIAIHLFIDAFPAGWMKAIMDCDRNPKPAYFAYRDALTPVMLSLRGDRNSYHPGETASVEVWGCNDESRAYQGLKVHYEIRGSEKDRDESIPTANESGPILGTGEKTVDLPACGSVYLGTIEFIVPEVEQTLIVTAGIQGEEGSYLHHNSYALSVRKDSRLSTPVYVCVIGNCGKAAAVVEELGISQKCMEEMEAGDVFLVDDWSSYEEHKCFIDEKISRGAKAIFLELDPGEYQIGEMEVSVKNSGMLPMNFASRNTGHPLVKGFTQFSFWNWYDKNEDRIAPILDKTFTGTRFTPVLLSGNTNEDGEWNAAAAVGEGRMEKGLIYLCQLKLAGRVSDNPVAKEFFFRMLTNA
ncbi:MAG TPA: hypothetical protein IAC62_17670 [Candidatus Pelethocola excrementipullorum]|nr:hypothetical protein [Candidatus Pelethocola excrementipullorum]